MKKKELAGKGFKAGDEIAYIPEYSVGPGQSGKVITGIVASDDLHGIISDDYFKFRWRDKDTELLGVNFYRLNTRATIKDAIPIIVETTYGDKVGSLIRAREIDRIAPIAERDALDDYVADRQAEIDAAKAERERRLVEANDQRKEASATIEEVIGYPITDHIFADPVALLEFAEEYHQKKSGQ